ncbi:MAG: VWA-like domain-containing protein [Campylobacterota bacterium]|nr:VWA-like domain-containing protein [Campylobacterota bacterium]
MTVAKISKAKAKLLVEYPYFGNLASRLELRESQNIQAFISDGVIFQYNSDYINELSDDELGFALSNGALHAALSHENRRNERLSWLWQLASDHAINSMLIENGMSEPKYINYQPRFDGMYAEEIYAVLKDEIQNEEYDDESNDTGFNEENKRQQQQMHEPNQNDAKEKNRPEMEVDNVTKEEQWQQHLDKATQQALEGDELPLGIERFVDISYMGKIDWRHELHSAIEKHFRSDYTQVPPSKKLLYSGIYLPSLNSEMLRLAIAIDSSGSVDEELLSQFIAEVESLMMLYPQHEVELFVCDSKIRSHETYCSGEMLNVTIKGGGATDFRPVFEQIEKGMLVCNLLLYFSDTQGTFPLEAPNYETIWVTPAICDVPFGRAIPLNY